MQDLRLVGVHEDGAHVLLAGPDGTRYRVLVDDALREATRRERGAARTDSALTDEPMEPLRPRDVQAMIRAGVGVPEVAERSGWSEEKVRKYEPPIRAEREYVAGLARAVQLRGRGRDGDQPTLGSRAAARLDERGVESERVSWDSWKTENGTWTVVCEFPAGGRERRATWRFDPRDRTLAASDDEARWLGEDEQAPSTAPSAPGRGSGRPARVYDVEAEGGVNAQDRHPAGKARSGARARPGQEVPAEAEQEPLDLMSAMRQRSAERRKRPPRRAPSPTDTPVAPEEMPDDARPLERLHLADVAPPMGSHPAAHELEDQGHQGPDDTDLEDEDAHEDLEDDGADGTAPVEPVAQERENPEVTRVPARQSGSRRGRPAVPSWDDIMFGTRPSSDH
ncbi:septation protein SepH [Luteipulveratus flavus]|uniref:Septation protein SepH n=1 Tax=Luteipulveratus flavus TaxID=3031728 RepID=A0ABT6CAA0_9MICO|nr:septation protein SepH [Luteipulveratus sp. YIM 133296]MDF8265833.1 septation protein SepH [Luteipulveratus sp. YIM 133296]